MAGSSLAERRVADRARAARLRVGDPASEETEVGPLRSAEDLATVEALVEEAVAGGAELVCGGPTRVSGLAGAFYAPVVLRRVPAEARILHEPLSVLARASVEGTPHPPELFRAAYLVERDAVERFTEAVGRLQNANQGLSLLCTGPWPPYTFMQD